MQKLEEKALKKSWKNWTTRLGRDTDACLLSDQLTLSTKKAHEKA